MAENIRKFDGALGFTGSPSSPHGPDHDPSTKDDNFLPHLQEEGHIEFEMKKIGGLCCARVVSAPLLVANIETVYPSDPKKPTFSPYSNAHLNFDDQGIAGMEEHEERRLEVYRLADEAFLAPAEGAGAMATDCGWVCRDSFGDARNELRVYVDKVQAEAQNQYNDWVAKKQWAIGRERAPSVMSDFEGKTNGLSTLNSADYLNVPPLSKPDPTWTTPCPDP